MLNSSSVHAFKSCLYEINTLYFFAEKDNIQHTVSNSHILFDICIYQCGHGVLRT